ncbi:hypothetical protein [Mesoterricola sediminis]|uniref:hypothetical protein n=1 Tax=Mesoterricola sediminis TaxID=2927980 RepID=UPI0029305191|nr:hypothetical protein [Mesoterricola sediminis]
MFIRSVQTSQGKVGTSFNNHQLVESYRAEAGPRQRLITNLGSLDLPRERWKDLAAALDLSQASPCIPFIPVGNTAGMGRRIRYPIAPSHPCDFIRRGCTGMNGDAWDAAPASSP